MEAPLRWTTLLRFTNLHEAEIARGALEAEEIPVQLLDTGMVGVAHHLSTAIGGVRLQVPEEEAARALEVLGSLGEGPFDDESDSSPDEDEDDHEDLVASPGAKADALARRAMVAALAGFFLPFVLHAWSLALLFSFSSEQDHASAQGRRHAAVALVLDVVFLGPILFLVARALG